MILGDIFAVYRILREVSNLTRKLKKRVEVLPRNRWIADRESILSEFKYSDTYLSNAYVKGRDGKSRYWSTGILPNESEKNIKGLIRRVIVFEEGMSENSILINDDGTERKIIEWIQEQQSYGTDILIAKCKDVMDGLSGNKDLVESFRAKKVRRAIKKSSVKDEIDEKVWNELDREDVKILDIGIYGLAAVGMQITGEMGEPLAFVLSKDKRDVQKAIKYFNILCLAAKRIGRNSQDFT